MKTLKYHVALIKFYSFIFLYILFNLIINIYISFFNNNYPKISALNF